MNNNLNLKLNYITNFNPIFYKKYHKFKNKNKKKIFCRNLFLFLFLLKFSNIFFEKIKIYTFIKPKKKIFLNLLKAPYKNKISKNQIGFLNYFIVFKINFFIELINFYNFNQFFFFINNFLLFFNFIETNFIKNNKINIMFKFKKINFFKFKY